MALDPKKLERWLREQLCVEHEGWGKAIRIDVRHCKAREVGAASVVCVEVDEDFAERLDDPERADRAIEAAVRSIGVGVQAHLEGLGGGKQKYVILSYFANSLTPKGELPFTEQGAGMDGGGDFAGFEELGSGNAPAQFFAVAARYNLGLSAQNLQATDLAVRALTRENDRLTRSNERLLAMHEDMIALREKLAGKQHKRELATLEAKSKIERKDRVVRDLSGLVPLVAHKFLGGGGAWSGRRRDDEEDDESTDAGDSRSPQTTIEGMVRGLMETLEEDQLREIRPHLDDELFMLVWELAKATQATPEENRRTWQTRFAAGAPIPAGDTPIEWMVDLLDRSLSKAQRAGIEAALTQVQVTLFRVTCQAIREKRAQQSATAKH